MARTNGDGSDGGVQDVVASEAVDVVASEAVDAVAAVEGVSALVGGFEAGAAGLDSPIEDPPPVVVSASPVFIKPGRSIRSQNRKAAHIVSQFQSFSPGSGGALLGKVLGRPAMKAYIGMAGFKPSKQTAAEGLIVAGLKEAFTHHPARKGGQFSALHANRTAATAMLAGTEIAATKMRTAVAGVLGISVKALRRGGTQHLAVLGGVQKKWDIPYRQVMRRSEIQPACMQLAMQHWLSISKPSPCMKDVRRYFVRHGKG